MQLIKNRCLEFGAPLPSAYAEAVGPAAPAAALEYFSVMLDYRQTQLVRLDGLARSLGIAEIAYKDEAGRFGLRSFKALGGGYAVARLVHRQAERTFGRPVSVRELLGTDVTRVANNLTVACATDGNHGRSVAWGARLLGCPCVIFLHENVSKTREEGITAYGASVVRVSGVYDDSVAEAARVAELDGWHIVSDFAATPFDEITSFVMQGYTLMVDEIINELNRTRTKLSHVFIQGGCGALAAAVVGHLSARVPTRPTFVVVEPDRANCLLQSAKNGVISKIEMANRTCMTMLECYEPSHMAWPILARAVDFFMDMPDQAAIATARRVSEPVGNDPIIRAGVSGVAGLAGLIACLERTELARAVGLQPDSRVLIIGSEDRID